MNSDTESTAPDADNTGDSGGDVSERINNTPKTVEEMYQKKTPLEHILLRPDTYGTFPNCTF